ncbi:hypothetical protein [Nostoc sp. 'Lobaria pulmonaria (5183) cyanobiont']|uniref:hypothetical protein n=1 Tax=Nostoc sp. 'Lobaria pulmonaria (5183) cyanobiont' TaxID=1618022 RepID=UPI001319DB45|nr:hypothetical protein [Nostoc sp. 'Lobaria pulmonaria (5183) cyanobiont']
MFFSELGHASNQTMPCCRPLLLCVEEFCRWVYRFMGNAQFISPQHLAEQHQKFARALIDRYSSKAI